MLFKNNPLCNAKTVYLHWVNLSLRTCVKLIVGATSMLATITCNRVFAYCKGGNFNIQIWAWFGYFIC